MPRRSGPRASRSIETSIASSRTLWIIWLDRERPATAQSRRKPLRSAGRRPAPDQSTRAPRSMPPARGGRKRSSKLIARSLDPPEEDEDENDYENQPQAARRLEAPAAPIVPDRPRHNDI